MVTMSGSALADVRGKQFGRWLVGVADQFSVERVPVRDPQLPVAGLSLAHGQVANADQLCWPVFILVIFHVLRSHLERDVVGTEVRQRLVVGVELGERGLAAAVGAADYDKPGRNGTHAVSSLAGILTELALRPLVKGARIACYPEVILA